jgi:hypothetical protein
MPLRLAEPYRFLVDECLGLHDVPNALIEGLEPGEEVIRFQERFARGTEDEKWLPKAGAAGLVIVTKDGRLRYRPNERAALIEANTGVFTVTSGPGKVMGATLKLGLPTMRRVLRGQKTPFVGHVLPDGRVSLSIVNGDACSKIIKRPL